MSIEAGDVFSTAIIQFIDATFLGDEANKICQTSFFSLWMRPFPVFLDEITYLFICNLSPSLRPLNTTGPVSNLIQVDTDSRPQRIIETANYFARGSIR